MEIGKFGQCAVVGRTVLDKGQAVFWRGQTAFVAVESNNWRMLPKAGVRACGEPVTGSRCPDWGDSGLYPEPTRGSSSSRKCIESDLLQGADWAGSRPRRTAGRPVAPEAQTSRRRRCSQNLAAILVPRPPSGNHPWHGGGSREFAPPWHWGQASR